MFCSPIRSSARANLILISLVFLSGFAHAQDPKTPAPSEFPALDWMRDLLKESSNVTFPSPENGAQEVVHTRTTGLHSATAFVLTYERVSYDQKTPSRIDQRQIIMYDIDATWLDPESIAVQKQGDSALGDNPVFWIVTVTVRETPGFIEYDNLFESRTEDGGSELTRSRGQIRQIALGYFEKQEAAERLSIRFREFLNSIPKSEDAPAKRPTQSVA